MAKESQEKKKAGIVKRIFKWLGLVSLSILLIAALIFQAPWKVITLLVIILLACTILPKPARKWFWLSVAVVVIALIIWVFLPDDRGDWKPYKCTFDKELAAIEAKRAIPDSENAARIYDTILEDYGRNAMYPDFFDHELYRLTLSEPWSSEDYPKLAEWLESKRELINTLIEVSRIEKCRFPMVVTTGPTSLKGKMDRLPMIRQGAKLLIRAANNDLGEGRIDQAIEKNLTVLGMGKHQRQQPMLVDLLSAIAIEALAIHQFNRFVITGGAEEEHLTLIEEALAEIKHDWSSDLPRILEYGKLSVKGWFGKFYEVNPEGKIRISHDPHAEMRAYLRKKLQGRKIDNAQMKELKKIWKLNAYPNYFQRKLIKAHTVLRWFYVPSTPEKAAKIIDAVYEKYYAMAEPDFDWQKEPREFPITSLFRFKFNYTYLIEHLAGMSEGTYYRIHDIYLRVIADKRGSQIIIALRRYKNQNGHWPESLEDIKHFAPAKAFIDPQNGGAFVYKLTEENFTLYSKGKNNIDDGGKRDKSREPKTGADDWLIWPQRSRKTQEKNTDVKQH